MTDVLAGGDGADRLYGGAGRDTASYAGHQFGVALDLSAGTAWDGWSSPDVLSGIEDVIGGAQSDWLTGDGQDNVIEGGAVRDGIIGGGNDTASYAGSGKGVIVQLQEGTVAGWGAGGDAEGDTILEVEAIIGSGLDDRLMGNSGANTIEGGAGKDYLSGGPSAGQGGRDTASYAHAGTGVAVSLSGVHEDGSGGASGTGAGAGQGAETGSAGANPNNDASGDTLSGFEDLLGSAFNDTLSGDGGGNSLWGEGGDDILDGGLTNTTNNRVTQLIREYCQ